MKKNQCIITLIIVYFVLSIIFIDSPEKKRKSGVDIRSSELRRIISKDDWSERIDYIDEFGEIAIAADLGYASIVIFQTEKGKIEKYYDEKGEPVSRHSGYYSVLHEYDEKGNNIKNTYYDMDDSLFTLPDGYSIEIRAYDDNNRIISTEFYDKDNNPTNTWSFGYGRIYGYDEEGNNNRITYIDIWGNPMKTKLGYASVVRTFYKSDSPQRGKIEDEFYFDEDEHPVALSLGQYGVHKEYDENGQNSIQTYLDAGGNPVITKKGYTTVKRTFYADGSVATEQYYDINNQPYKLPEGQYGIRKDEGRTNYLNQEGTEIFNFRNFLYNQTRLAILITIALIILTSFINKRINALLLLIITGAIFYLTLFYRDNVTIKANFEPFWSYRQAFYDSDIRSEILKNIWLFIPLGTVLYRIYPGKRMIVICVLLSVGIEIVQYTSGKGLCELDDIISNSLGGCIGIILGKLTANLKTRINSWKHIHNKKRR